MSSRSVLVSAGVLALLIAFASLLPPGAKHQLHTEGSLHPWFHTLAFCVLAALCTSATPDRRLRILLLLAIFLLAWGTEFLESLRDGWPVERHDVLLDAVGIILGSAAALFRPTARLR